MSGFVSSRRAGSRRSSCRPAGSSGRRPSRWCRSSSSCRDEAGEIARLLLLVEQALRVRARRIECRVDDREVRVRVLLRRLCGRSVIRKPTEMTRSIPPGRTRRGSGCSRLGLGLEDVALDAELSSRSRAPCSQWLKPRSFRPPVSVTRPTLIASPAVVSLGGLEAAPLVSPSSPPPQPAAARRRSREQSQERKPRPFASRSQNLPCCPFLALEPHDAIPPAS